MGSIWYAGEKPKGKGWWYVVSVEKGKGKGEVAMDAGGDGIGEEEWKIAGATTGGKGGSTIPMDRPL